MGILVEFALLVLPSVFRTPVDSFDYIAISIQCLRLFNFMILPCLYIWLRNRNDSYENDDEEQQSLLGSRLADGPPSSEGSNNAGYGAITETENQDSHNKAKKKLKKSVKKDPTVEHDFGDDDYLKNKFEDEERIAKRLKDDGNWWTYAKGFAVGVSPYFNSNVLT